MPVPGPRTQARPTGGYRNPDRERPTRLQLWSRPGPIEDPGRTPGTMVRDLRGMIQAAGQIRRDWTQAVNMIAAQAPYSWTRSAPGPGRPIVSPAGLGITRALRYMTRSVYIAGGTDNTRFAGLHTKIMPKVRSKPVSVGAGQVRSRPTVRNRLSSFGSRVPSLNAPIANPTTDNPAGGPGASS